MSLIVTVWTNEGIVMGSDSRISFSSMLAPNIPVNIHTGHYFDTQEKTFVCSNGCGISTCGAASLQGKNITGFINNYIDTQVQSATSICDTANNLKNYIQGIDNTVEVHFIVAGYDTQPNGTKVQNVYTITTGVNSSIINLSTNGVGVKWDGEIDTLSRIIKAHFLCAQPIQVPGLNIGGMNVGDAYVLPASQTAVMQESIISWHVMTLQDAIDFVRYAINTTIDTMRFTNVNKTVGGAIDILVIKPNKSQWIAHKKLH